MGGLNSYLSDSEKTLYDVKFAPADKDNYDEVTGFTATVKVNPASADILGTLEYNKIYGDEDFTLDAYSTAGLPLTYD